MESEPVETRLPVGRRLRPGSRGSAARGVRGTRRIATFTLLLGLVMLSASVAPSVIARAPGNDKFGHATTVGSLPFHKVENTRSAHTQESDPTPSCQFAGQTVWFTLTPESETSIQADTDGSTYDTVLAIYGQTGSGVDGLVEVDCNDDVNVDNRVSEIEFVAKANTTYYLMVGTCCRRTSKEEGRLEFNLDLAK